MSKSKPKSAKRRNLTMRGGVIYYERLAHGKRIRISTKTASWEDAASFRDAFEAHEGIGRVPFFAGEVPLFGEFAKRYLLEADLSHLAPTTRSDRNSYLSERGPLVTFFGNQRLDAISTEMLHVWWKLHITDKGRSTVTGKHYLEVLAEILDYAKVRKLIESDPVEEFRKTLKRRNRTARGRAHATPHIRPIETADELERLVESAQVEGEVPHAFVVALLDAGLRVGEALGLKWGAIRWGADEDDATRSLVIDCSRPRGGAEGLTKSGRARVVALSRRLRSVLYDLYRSRFEPGSEALVFPGLNPMYFYRGEWRRVCKRAGLGHRMLKDLRDTFASQLLTAGVPLGYVSMQLGHADVAITAKHYAKWCGDDYIDPMQREYGEVPADFLARLGVPSPSPHAWTSPQRNQGFSGAGIGETL